MSLKVIGSGFGRTGTMSTKLALEELGFGPCHHMVEVMQNPEQPAHWTELARGEEVDWAEVFAGYTSQVDNPGAVYWHELSIAFPEAKVIHTERPEDDWWASYDHTINRFWRNRKSIALPPPVQAVFDDMDKILMQGGDAGLDREAAIAAYRANNARVMSQARTAHCGPTRHCRALQRSFTIAATRGLCSILPAGSSVSGRSRRSARVASTEL